MSDNINEPNKYTLNEIVVGKVSGIQNYGAFVTFNDEYRGLIHISEISSKFVKSIEDFVTIGDEVRVKIIEIDQEHHTLKLSLKQVAERERQNVRQKTLLRKAKVKIPEEECDFTPLKEKLPTWISEALKGDK